MLRSLFSQKNIVKNIAVFLIVFVVMFFGKSTAAFAGDSTYNNYKYLFAGTPDGTTPIASTSIINNVLPTGAARPTISGIVYNGAKQLNTAKTAVSLLSFGVGFSFNNQIQVPGFQGYEKPASWFWDRVSKEGTGGFNADNFVVRVCKTNGGTKFGEQKWENDNCTGYKVLSNLKVDNDQNYNKLKILLIGSPFKYNAADNKTTAITSNPEYQFNDSVQADLWYCAGPASPYGSGTTQTLEEHGEVAYEKQTGNIKDPLITRFGSDICGGTSFFRIGQPVTFSIAATAADAEKEITTDTATVADIASGKTDPGYTKEGGNSNLPECSLGVLPGTPVRIVGCIARGIYYAIYTPLSWIAGFFGMLFDFFLGYSTSDESYRYGFVNDAWVIIRDLSNIFFIIILVYTGFATVFGIKSVNMKSVVPGLIINALLINFSLLGTRVVIDLSNVVSRVFYSQIKVCSDDSTPCTSFKTNGAGGYTPVSEGIVGSFNPQKVFESKNFTVSENAGTNTTGDATFDTHNSAVNANFNKTLSADEYAGYFIVISLFAAFIMVALIKIFWSMSFLLLGRVVGLYVSMIFSPFAILSMGNMPLVGKLDKLRYDDWLKDVSSYALMAPIFIFFLYVVYGFMQKISSFVNIDNIDGTTPNFLTSVLSICIPMAIVYMFVDYGVSFAKKYSGTIGSMIQAKVDGFTGGAMTLAGTAVGGAAGLASGGIGLIGSRVGGRAAEALSKSSLGRWATTNASNNRFARMANSGIKRMGEGSWDPRNTRLAGLAKKAADSTGLKTNDKALTSLASLGAGLSKLTGRGNILDYTTKRTEGGFRGQMKRRIKEAGEQLDNDIDFSHLSDDEAKTALAQRQAKLAEERVVKGVAAKDAVYQNAQAAIDTANSTVEATTKTLEANKKILKEQKAQLSSSALETLNNNIETDAKKIKEQKKLIAEQKIAQEKKIKAVKNSDYKNSATYDADLKTAFEEQQKADKKKYGNVKTGTQLTQLMRIERREEVLRDSLFFKNGEPKQGMWALGGGIGGALGAFGGIYGSGGLGAMASEGMKFEQEAMQKMLQGTKKMKTLSNIDKLEQAVTDMDEQIEKHLINHAIETIKKVPRAAGMPPLTPEELETQAKAKIKKYTDDEKKDSMQDHSDNLKFEYESAQQNYDLLKNEFTNGQSSLSTEKQAEAEYVKAQRDAPFKQGGKETERQARINYENAKRAADSYRQNFPNGQSDLKAKHKNLMSKKNAYESAEKAMTEREKKQTAYDKAKAGEENKTAKTK